MKLNAPHIHDLGHAQRIWSITSPNGDVQALNRIHSWLWQQAQPGDRIVYHGNYLGNPARPDNPDAIDAILMFKRALVETNRMAEGDIVCLKGLREHLLQKLLVLQFADNPMGILQWLLSNGMEGLLNHYGTTGHEGLAACRGGTVTLIRWINHLRQNMHAKTGHSQFYQSLRAAASITCNSGHQANILFVHSGIDPSRALNAQEDAFWWAARDFANVPARFCGYDRIVRGYDPTGGETYVSDHLVSLSGFQNSNEIVQCAEISTVGTVKNIYSF